MRIDRRDARSARQGGSKAVCSADSDPRTNRRYNGRNTNLPAAPYRSRGARHEDVALAGRGARHGRIVVGDALVLRIPTALEEEARESERARARSSVAMWSPHASAGKSLASLRFGISIPLQSFPTQAPSQTCKRMRQHRKQLSHVCLWNSPIPPENMKPSDYVGIVRPLRPALLVKILNTFPFSVS